MAKSHFKIARLVTNEATTPKANLVGRFNLINSASAAIDSHINVLQTPGGFIWVKTDFKDCPFGEDSCEEDFTTVTKFAEEAIGDDIKILRKVSAKKADFITLGVDVLDWDEEFIRAELVGTFDVNAGVFVNWTGKSYPTPEQARSLLYCLDMESHAQLLNGKRVLVIGCHDFNMFSPRSIANINKGNRKTYKAWAVSSFHEVVEEFKPEVLLHHPHDTVLIKTWSTPKSGMNQMLPKLEAYSSGIHYYDPDKDPEKYSGLERVLNYTKKGDVIDILCTSDVCRVIR